VPRIGRMLPGYPPNAWVENETNFG
jgi:hypothetical protein